MAWTEEEDHLLMSCIGQYGEGKWHRVPQLAGNNSKYMVYTMLRLNAKSLLSEVEFNSDYCLECLSCE